VGDLDDFEVKTLVEEGGNSATDNECRPSRDLKVSAGQVIIVNCPPTTHTHQYVVVESKAGVQLCLAEVAVYMPGRSALPQLNSSVTLPRRRGPGPGPGPAARALLIAAMFPNLAVLLTHCGQLILRKK